MDRKMLTSSLTQPIRSGRPRVRAKCIMELGLLASFCQKSFEIIKKHLQTVARYHSAPVRELSNSKSHAPLVVTLSPTSALPCICVSLKF